MKTKAGSVAPKERINIVYKPNDAGARDKVELPLRLLVTGDFTNQQDSTPMSERDMISVNRKNLDSVIKSLGVGVDISVPNKMVNNPDATLDVNFQVDSIKGFSPDQVVEKVPELKKLIELRKSLVALKGPIGNSPSLRKDINALLESAN